MRQVSICSISSCPIANNVGKQMNDYRKVADEMVDEAFAKSNSTT
jgi:hypothetical protein